MIFGHYAEDGSIIRADDGATIPADPANRDFQAAIAAVAAGDTITAYVAPPAPTPSLRPDQFWAMIAIANLQPTVDAALSSITDPTQKAIATAKLNHSPVFYRDNDFVVQLSAAAGLSTTQVDALWAQAAAIP